jgi:hypothetical protein
MARACVRRYECPLRDGLFAVRGRAFPGAQGDFEGTSVAQSFVARVPWVQVSCRHPSVSSMHTCQIRICKYAQGSCICIHTYVCYTHTYIHTHIHTYIRMLHTYIHACVQNEVCPCFVTRVAQMKVSAISSSTCASAGIVHFNQVVFMMHRNEAA